MENINNFINKFLLVIALFLGVIYLRLRLSPLMPSENGPEENASTSSQQHQHRTIGSYHNTLLVDIFPMEEFSNFENVYTARANLSLHDRIIVSERIYNLSTTNHRKTLENGNWSAANDMISYFPPSFNCPHFKERIGSAQQNGKWICGLGLYETDPKPPECVIYMIKDHQNKSDENILNELANRTDCHILSFHIDKESVENNVYNRRIQVIPHVGVGVNDEEDKKTLRSLMKTNGHAWIDMLFLDIGGRELPVLKQIIEDFYEIFPVGQLHVVFHVETVEEEGKEYFKSSEKFKEWFESLERKGFRPFHAEAGVDNSRGDERSETVVEYGFMNIRGKHLLLTGRTDI